MTSNFGGPMTLRMSWAGGGEQRGESLRELRVSLRELRELKVFCLKACSLENKRIEKNKGTSIILIGWRIKNDFFFLALNYSA